MQVRRLPAQNETLEPLKRLERLEPLFSSNVLNGAERLNPSINSGQAHLNYLNVLNLMRATVVCRVTLAFLFCLVVVAEAQTKDVNLGWSGQGSWTTLPYVVAKERGFFEKEGLKVQLITFRGTNLMLTALLAGELDYATSCRFLPAPRRAVCR